MTYQVHEVCNTNADNISATVFMITPKEFTQLALYYRSKKCASVSSCNIVYYGNYELGKTTVPMYCNKSIELDRS